MKTPKYSDRFMPRRVAIRGMVGALVGVPWVARSAEPEGEKGAGKPKGDSEAENAWQVLASGKMAEAAVEKTVYKDGESDRFYMRVRVTNRSKKEIGVRLEYWKVIFPNQWGAHNSKERMIDEGRMIPAEGLEREKREVFDSFLDGNLTQIPPGKSVTYFRDFNGPAGRKKMEEQGKGMKFFIVSMDGMLVCSDGDKVESLDCEWTEKKGPEVTDVVIEFPLKWKKIPEGAMVLEDE